MGKKPKAVSFVWDDKTAIVTCAGKQCEYFIKGKIMPLCKKPERSYGFTIFDKYGDDIGGFETESYAAFKNSSIIKPEKLRVMQEKFKEIYDPAKNEFKRVDGPVLFNLR